jgi:hypothetical protein
MKTTTLSPKSTTLHFIKPIPLPEYVEKIKITTGLKYGANLIELVIGGKTYRLPYSSILCIIEE